MAPRNVMPSLFIVYTSDEGGTQILSPQSVFLPIWSYSSHLSCEISLGALVHRCGEHGGGIAVFYQFAKVHEHGL